MSRSAHRPDLPDHQGVPASCLVTPTQRPAPWSTMLNFLDHRMPAVGRGTWAQRLASGHVLAADGVPLPVDAPFQAGARVYYYRELPDEPVIPFEETVLYQDDHLVVADKPHFLPVTPGGRFVQQTLLTRLQRRLCLPQLAPMHRIDRETAGLVLFAVQPHERGAYHALFGQRAMHKIYEAIAPYRADLVLPLIRHSRIEEHPGDFFRMHEVPDDDGVAPNSASRIELKEQRGHWARYRLEPISGKRHQLRVHMNALGVPIVGDQLYPTVLRGPDESEDFSTPLCLLAQTISFRDPVTGQSRHFETTRQLSLDAGGLP